MNGWLTTKKLGRDDDLIEHDKRAAEDERRRRKGLKPKQKKPAPKQKTLPSSSLLDNFVVDDDDEVEWSDEPSEEEDDEGKVPMSSDSEVSDTFMGGAGTKRRTSKPSKGLVARSQNKFISKKKATVVNLAYDSSSEEEELVISPKDTSKLCAKTFHERPKPTKHSIQMDFSSDDDSALLDTQSKYFAKKPKPSSLLDIPVMAVKKNASKRGKEMTALMDSSDDDVPQKRPRKLVKTKKSEKFKKKKAPIQMEDYCSDEDEAIALAAAMEESRKLMENETMMEEKEIINLQDDESSVGEDFVDEEAKAATSVLETANKLSALILKTMAKWSNSAVEGMIVDGAISLGEAKGRDHTWISQESLRDIVPPEIKLADYQLIGVNWMALLHGMKCEVEGNQTYTNVNGILADEMGLGTSDWCQTRISNRLVVHRENMSSYNLSELVEAQPKVRNTCATAFNRRPSIGLDQLVQRIQSLCS